MIPMQVLLTCAVLLSLSVPAFIAYKAVRMDRDKVRGLFEDPRDGYRHVKRFRAKDGIVTYRRPGVPDAYKLPVDFAFAGQGPKGSVFHFDLSSSKPVRLTPEGPTRPGPKAIAHVIADKRIEKIAQGLEGGKQDFAKYAFWAICVVGVVLVAVVFIATKAYGTN